VKTRRTFGFVCPQFSVDVSASGFLLPRSRGATLAKRLLPEVATASVSGRYNITVHEGGAEAWRLPALVAWARHRAGAGPFLAFKVAKRAEALRRLAALAGRDVELEFVPRAVPLDITLRLQLGDPDATPSRSQGARPQRR
jgi:hypothetical protein